MSEMKEVKAKTKAKPGIDWREIGVSVAVNAVNGVILGLTSAAIYRVASPRVKPASTPELTVIGGDKDTAMRKNA